MKVTKVLLTCSLAALLFATSPLLAATLIVQVRSNYVSGVDVTTAMVRMGRTPAPPGDRDARRDRDRETFPLTRGIDLNRGVRIADLDLVGFTLFSEFAYAGEVSLEDATGRVVARRPLRISWRRGEDPLVVTVLISKPVGEAQKTCTLLEDRDSDGAISIGDVVRYHVTLAGEGTGSFADWPSEGGGSLIAGSVVKFGGLVVAGNRVGDTHVHVDGIPFDGGGVATVQYDVVVEPALVNQGALQLRLEGATGRYHAIGDYVTDDPTTPAPNDPTVSPIAAGAAYCLELQDLLFKFSDPDSDGVPTALDQCPASAAGEPVDSRGCSQAQFCKAAGAASGEESAADLCEASDFRNDEPLLSSPGDCFFDLVTKSCLPVSGQGDPLPPP